LLDIWEVDLRNKILVAGVTQSQYRRLDQQGYLVEIDWYLTEEVNRPVQRLPGQTSGIPGFLCYRTVAETFAAAEALVNEYPTLAAWIDIGDSWEKIRLSAGSDLLILRLTNAAVPGPKPKLFLMASMHAREYAPAEMALRFAEHLLENYGLEADPTWLLDYHEIHLLLQANPDGRMLAELGESTPYSWWRKNTNQDYCLSDSYGRGADLNRNFSFNWGCCGGSSSNSCNLVFRGASAASEPETAVVEDYLRDEYPDRRSPSLDDPAPEDTSGLFLDLHSYGSLVLWPWGFSTQAAPNAPALRSLGKRLAFFNHYEPMQSYELYTTDGTSIDFAYGELGLPAYTIEVGVKFHESCTNFEDLLLPANLPALIYFAKAARLPYQIPSGPEVVDLSLSPGWFAERGLIQVIAQIDDSRLFNGYASGEIEPVQSIQEAEAYLDVPPWITTTIPIPVSLTALDGSFDNSLEWVTGSLEPQELTPGQHIVFIRGRDQAGNWGPVSARFIDVPAVSLFLPWVSR
jgi:hypothetical protein